MGEWITIGNKPAESRAWLSRPAAGAAPGVLLFHAWWGLNDFFRELSERLSAEGFVSLAPDYLGGQVAATINHASELAAGMERKAAYALAKQSLDHLLSQPFVLPKAVGVIGFSLGCGPALELARSRPDVVTAAVLFYGTGGGRFDNASADFLGHFAEHDEWGAHTKKVAALQQRLAASGGSVSFYTYPGTDHWFFERDRADAYDDVAAQLAWERTVAFLRKTLV